jgi:hypothetical protein
MFALIRIPECKHGGILLEKLAFPWSRNTLLFIQTKDSLLSLHNSL